MADRRHYGQLCGLAAALDVAGERWTMLILHELLTRPARFGEIADNLPGIGPNLLTDRLKHLTERGLIDSAPVPGDRRGKQYRLTELGEALRPTLESLAGWGTRVLTEADGAHGIGRPGWSFLALQAMIDDAQVPDAEESYEFRVDDEVFHVAVNGGRTLARRGPADDPVLRVCADASTFMRIGAGISSPFDAMVGSELTIEGDPEAVRRCMRLIGLSTPSSP